MASKNSVHMWEYWRDKKGLEEALVCYYPDILEADPQLQVALAQMRNAELVINTLMSEKEDDETM